jgi:1-acyl-sn-glycerol-3-phosphate acyltransferase
MTEINQYFSESPCCADCVPPGDDPPHVGQVRYALRHAALFMAGLLGAVAGYFARFTGQRTAQFLLKVWARAMLRAMGIRTEVAGEVRSTRPVLVVGNHITLFDSLPLLARYRITPVMTEDIKQLPFGSLFHHAGAILVARGSLAALRPLTAATTARLREGHSVVAAPEGVIRCSPPGGRFSPAIFQAAVDAGVDVRPLMIKAVLRDGSPTAHASSLGDEYWPTVCRIMRLRGLVLHLTILDDIEPGGHNRRDLARRANEEIDAAAAGLPRHCVSRRGENVATA